MLKTIIRFYFRRAAMHAWNGRYRDRDRPSAGRLTKADVRAILKLAWGHADSLIPQADFSQFRSRGNRLNVYLCLLSLACYRALREYGLSAPWATELFADTGWYIYERMAKLVIAPSRPFTRDPQKRINFMLRALMIFPFNEDPNGYQRKAWKEADHMRTDWTRCAPLDFVRKVGTPEELVFFRATWCWYDYALPGLVDPRGDYERPHTLSDGDSVCDMRWYGIRVVRKDEMPERE